MHRVILLTLAFAFPSPSSAATPTVPERIVIGVSVAAAFIESHACPNLKFDQSRLSELVRSTRIGSGTERRADVDFANQLAHQLADDFHVDRDRTCKEIWESLGDDGPVPGIIKRRD